MKTEKTWYADVIVDISQASADRPFQYRVPPEMVPGLHVGSAVRVPFGNGKSLRNGFVIGFRDTPEIDPARIRDIGEIGDSRLGVQSQLIALAAWMKETCGATMNQALRTVLPVKQRIRPKEKKAIRLLASPEALAQASALAARRGYRARMRLLAALRETPEIPMEIARNQLRIAEPQLRPLEEQGIIAIETQRVLRTPLTGAKEAGKTVELNPGQQSAVDSFIENYDRGDRKPILLFGITGSGKTEVYMEMMAHVLRQGKEVILLIPEISLTYQTVFRFYRRFGSRIAILNSRLSAGERYDQWEMAERGDVQIMIGPRSALFAPFRNLGLIIIDEEHETSYKSEQAPRYHAREAAMERARLAGAALVLGSATPSLESYRRALTGEYRLLRLTRRAAAGSVLPKAGIVDMRRELALGNRTIFSGVLREAVEDRLRRGEQVMLFINRRGFSNFVSCRSCGKPIRCPHCDVSLTLHGRNRLVCHYCGYEMRLPDRCPACGSPYLAGFGTGTQKLEEMTRTAFPGARVLRMDADTAKGKEGGQKILEAFGAGEADILVGTQMIVKGHDFGNVTLVGIMAADLSLNTPDFRAAERTFQLITQAAGRAGRGSRPGQVLIQTYEPGHYAVRAAAAQDYEGFYRQEMAYREAAGYPPAGAMLSVFFSAGREKDVIACADACAEAVRAVHPENYGARAVGPADAPVYRVKDAFRKIFYVKAGDCAILIKIRKIIAKTAADPAFSRVLLLYDLQ